MVNLIEKNWCKVYQAVSTSGETEIQVLQRIERNVYHKKLKESLKPILFHDVSYYYTH